MILFVSYAFNEENRWIEELALPLIKALGFQVVTGQRLEGEELVGGVESRMEGCRGCVAFTTRREQHGTTYTTHQWVLDEMARARQAKMNVLEVREEGVTISGSANSYVQLRYCAAERDKLLVALAEALAKWPVQSVNVQIVPPQGSEEQFRRHVLQQAPMCKYHIRQNGRRPTSDEAYIIPKIGGFFADIEVPREDVLVQIEIEKAGGTGAWKSVQTGLVGIPIQVFDT